MDRHRGGGGAGADRYGVGAPDSRPYRNSRAPPPRGDDTYPINNHHNQNHTSPPANYYNSGFSGGGGRDRAPLNSPPRFPPSGGGGGGRGPGFRPIGSGGGRDGPGNFDQQAPVTGQKRGFPFSAPAISPDNHDGASFAKLFVGSVPKTATEEEIRPLFDQHGRVLEVALIKDKRTGQQQGCCFIKYATSVEADRAIRALHNQHTLPGGVNPIQVRYADGERERLGEYKLFVGSLYKQATEKEVEEIFSPYGRVEDVYLMRDEMKQSRGCGFVKYSSQESAMAAINSLSGIYTMRGCEQPLTVRFADAKRPRPGESRNAPSFGGPGFGPRFQPPGVRPMPNTVETMHNHSLPNTWHPMSPQNQGPSDVGIRPSDVGIRSFSTRFPAPSTPGGSSAGGFSGSADGPPPVFPVSSSSTLPQNYNHSMPQVPSFSQKISPLQQQPHQSSQQFPSSMQSQSSGSYSQKQTTAAQPTQSIQLRAQTPATQTPFSQTFPSQKLLGVNGQLPVSQSQNQQSLSPAAAQTPSNVPPHALSGMANQQQLNQFPQPLHQTPSQLTAQMLSQQTQALQARLQSSQQAVSQIQQQMQMMQPSNQSFAVQQGLKASNQQTSWAGMTPQTSASAKVIPPVTDGPAATAASVIPEMTHAAVPLKCNWTEHTSPEGFKYYYNSTTGESKWEKPEELSSFEKQQSQLQKSSVQQPQSQFQPQGLSTQQVSPNPQGQFQSQLQPQLRYPQQLQQPSQSSSYQAPGFTGQQGTQDLAYKQLPVVASSVNDPSRFQQGLQGAQEWMWKNKPTGA